MITAEQKKLIVELWNKELICVVSTLDSDGRPESAAVAFTSFDDLSLAFQTPSTTRKYKNLKDNLYVSVVIGWNISDMRTIQYEGIVHEVNSEAETSKVRNAQLKKNPKSKKYAYLEENKYFVVKPTWIRYSDLINNIIFEEKYEQ